jgi:uncharacterized protein YndB with AHSA1/START domain
MIEPVRKSVHVGLPVEDAFRVFTERFADWWPVATHSAYEADAATVVLETGEGGRLYEVSRRGEENTWGRVTAWEPPGRLVLTWSPNLEPAPDTEIEVRFTANGSGTDVELEHRAWEVLGERAETTRDAYEQGWRIVLGGYAAAAR